MALMAKVHLKINGLVFGMNRKGFSLLELLIVIAIIGVLGVVLMPNIQRSTPRYEREAFIARFNALLQYAWQHALVTHTTQQITVDIAKKTITLLQESDEKDRSGAMVFKPIENPVQDTMCPLPDQINIKQFFIEGFDMMAKFSRAKAATVWFYIIPEGMTQDVVVNLVDTKDMHDNKPLHVGLVLNPFTAQFKIYDTFQKP